MSLARAPKDGEQKADNRSNIDEPLSPRAQRLLMLKIDSWILPCVALVFLLSFLDKTNIANAKVFGLSEDLELKGNEFNTALVVYFVAYAIFNIPATVALRELKPSFWMPFCTFWFGVISMCQGFVTSYSGLLATRFFLGATEACSFSGGFYVLSHWYKRKEAQKRFTFFYTSSQLAGAFGGLLASAIGLLDGRQGYAAWRWVFIVEGAVTAGLAICLFLVMPGFPQHSRYISQDEKNFILEKLKEDGNNELDDAPLTLKRIVAVITTPKVFISAFFYFILLIPAYAYAFFAPTIIKSYTEGAIHTQLLSVPPWACAFVASLALAWLSDRLQHRLVFVVLPLLLAIPGYSLLLTIHDKATTQYGAMFILALGVWVPLPVVVCWCTMNVQGHTDRGIALGWFFGISSVSGIPAVYLFLETDAPRYTTGYSTCMGCIVVGMLFALGYAAACRNENRKIKERALGGEFEEQDTNCEDTDARLIPSRVFNVI